MHTSPILTEKFRLERRDISAGYMMVEATCQDCKATFEVDLYTANLKQSLEKHQESCPNRPQSKQNSGRTGGSEH